MDDIIPELEQNQEVDPIKKEKNAFVLAMGEKCVESRMQEVLGLNPKTWNNLKNIGVIPRTGTNGEFLTKVFNYYRQQEGVAAAKVQATIEARSGRGFKSSDTDSGLPKIVEAEKMQKIRLDRARETEVHLKNLATRGQLLDKQALLSLITPLIGNIANVLRSAADEDPSLQVTIDKCFATLHSTGIALCGQADLDSDRYVQEMLNMEIDLDDLVTNTDLDVSYD